MTENPKQLQSKICGSDMETILNVQGSLSLLWTHSQGRTHSQSPAWPCAHPCKPRDPTLGMEFGVKGCSLGISFLGRGRASHGPCQRPVLSPDVLPWDGQVKPLEGGQFGAITCCTGAGFGPSAAMGS